MDKNGAKPAKYKIYLLRIQKQEQEMQFKVIFQIRKYFISGITLNRIYDSGWTNMEQEQAINLCVRESLKQYWNENLSRNNFGS